MRTVEVPPIIVQNLLQPPSIHVMKGMTSSKPLDLIAASFMPKVPLSEPIYTHALERLDAPSEQLFDSYGI